MLQKASKDSVIDGQQKFFEDLNRVESQVDRKRDQLILEEFKRLGDKIVAENTQLDIRVTALERLNNDERLRKQFDTKLDKEEFSDFITLLNEGTITPMQKDLEMCKKNVKCIEQFLHDLAVAI